MQNNSLVRGISMGEVTERDDDINPRTRFLFTSGNAFMENFLGKFIG